MANKKGYSLEKGFLFDYTWLDMFNSLSPKDAWTLFSELLEYQRSGGQFVLPTHRKKPIMDMMAATISYQIDRRLRGARTRAEVPTMVPAASEPPLKEEEGEEGEEYISFIHSIAREKDKFSEGDMGNSDARERTQRKRLFGRLGKGVVLLSDEQLDYLIDELSFDEFNKYIPIIADEELKGHRYTKKTHFQAILDMAKKDRRTR